MPSDVAPDLEQLGRDAARQVAGEGAVEQVEVMPGVDASDRPVYRFSFLIDQARAQPRAGLLRIRLIQGLRDALTARNDGHLPVVQILSRSDWDKRTGV